ncbi:hypothetical protein EJ04DRAFT_363911 [Polyplosphaeria fusca]|uniref:Uncharacterized protein n=1 Tax=Polyplosphaeria fusca TaxID=682080 RepID=A0A9P4V001_9PLEO|nr:hypothetical protein EJ04DRAFT_363911 [Polyplosphaeria fusca]
MCMAFAAAAAAADEDEDDGETTATRADAAEAEPPFSRLGFVRHRHRGTFNGGWGSQQHQQQRASDVVLVVHVLVLVLVLVVLVATRASRKHSASHATRGGLEALSNQRRLTPRRDSGSVGVSVRDTRYPYPATPLHLQGWSGLRRRPWWSSAGAMPVSCQS